MTEQLVPAPDLGPLFSSLAKAQTTFGAVVRDKKVTIRKKDGTSYSFQYAPLESILAAVQPALAANGLAVVQMLDDDHLVTSLVHSSGAYLTGRAKLPPTGDIKELGSAVTYLRRYAIQAMLGIAAEDDDDGSRATGDVIVSADVEHGDDGSLIGVVEVTNRQTSSFELKQESNHGHVIGFRLRGPKGGVLVRAFGPLAEQLDAARDAVIGARVSVWGRMETESLREGRGKVTYNVLTADRVRIPDVGDLPRADAPRRPTAEEQAELDGLDF